MIDAAGIAGHSRCELPELCYTEAVRVGKFVSALPAGATKPGRQSCPSRRS